MQTNTLVKISGMILLAVAVSLAMLVLIHVLQQSHGLLPTIATVSWNG
jgi:hypothetical protein